MVRHSSLSNCARLSKCAEQSIAARDLPHTRKGPAAPRRKRQKHKVADLPEAWLGARLAGLTSSAATSAEELRSVQGNLLSEESRSGWFFPKLQTFFAVMAGMSGDGASGRVCPLSGLQRVTAQAVLGVWPVGGRP
jgi:hypothetical protein